MKKNFFISLLLILVLSLSVLATNVILFIGDGMGTHQISVANYISEKLYNEQLCFLSFSQQSFVNTANASGSITDSAAAATALATGIRTNNSVIGLDANSRVQKNLSEKAKEKGKAVGIVTDDYVTDATPAGFVAHTSSRSNTKEISLAYLDLQPDVFMGMGVDAFTASTRRKNGWDDRDLLKELTDTGYSIAYNLSDLEKTSSHKVAGFFSSLDDVFAKEATTNIQPTLADMTKQALKILSQNEEGFFLMVEASYVDRGGHYNDVVGVVHNVLTLNNAVKEAIKFLETNPDTLIVVTADHETGGMSADPATLPEMLGKFEDVTQLPLDIDNTIGSSPSKEWVKEVFRRSGIKNVSEEDLQAISILSPGASRRTKIGQAITKYTGGAKFTTTGHSAQNVALYAIGQQSELFPSKLRNDELGQILARIVTDDGVLNK